MTVPPEFVHRERVRFGDLDAMRHHLNNARRFTSTRTWTCAARSASEYEAQRSAQLPEQLREALAAAAA